MPSGEVNGGAAPGALNAVKLGTLTYPGGGGTASGTFDLPPWASMIWLIGGSANVIFDYTITGVQSGIQYVTLAQAVWGGVRCPVLPALDSQLMISSVPQSNGVGTIPVIALGGDLPDVRANDIHNAPRLGHITPDGPSFNPSDLVQYSSVSASIPNNTDITTDVVLPTLTSAGVVDVVSATIEGNPALGSAFIFFQIATTAGAFQCYIASLYGNGGIVPPLFFAPQIGIPNGFKMQVRHANASGAALTMRWGVAWRAVRI